MIVDKKYKLKFNDTNLHNSVSYILVSKFDIMPSVLQARIDGSGGKMTLSMRGEENRIDEAIEHLTSLGITINPMENFVKRDENRCIDCGSCISLCPTFAFELNRDTFDVTLDISKCVACGFCLSACPTHAISLRMNI